MKPIQSSAVSRAPRVSQVKRLSMGVHTVRELYATFVRAGRWWMVPMIFVLGLTALLLVVVSAIEYVAPFVYTIF